MSNKKGQLYIVAAILLLTYAFAIARPSVSPKLPISSFQSLHKNFISETPVVVNNALQQSDNVSATFKTFVDDFSIYAKTKDPNFRLVYLLVDKDKLVVGNRLDDSVNVTIGDTVHKISSNQELTVNKAASADLLVNGITYSYLFNDDNVQLKAFFRKEDQNEIRVFVHK